MCCRNEQRPGSWPHYYLRLDKGAEGEPAVSGGLKDGTFRKNLKALALKHLGLAAPPQSPSPPVGGCGGGGAQPPPPPAAAQPAAAGLPPPTGPLDLDTLRNDRNKLREGKRLSSGGGMNCLIACATQEHAIS